MLRATGEQWEAFVAYGVVDQLMRTAGVSNARLLASRDRSLPAEEPVGVGARILEVIEDLEQKAPVAIVVDDAHWADVDSLRALLFVARRLVGERVLTFLAQRSEAAPRLPEGLRRMASGQTGTTISLSSLSASEVPSLAAALGVQRLSTQAARRLHAHTEGNPLYITTLLSEMPQERWRTWEPALPAPGAFATRVVAQAGRLQPEARRLVEAAAVLGSTMTLATPPRSRRWPTRSRPLDEAVDVDLLQLRDDTRRPRCRLQPSAGPGGRLRTARAGPARPPALRGGRPRRRRGVGAAPPGAGRDPARSRARGRPRRLRAAARRRSGPGREPPGRCSKPAGSARTAANREQRLLRAVDAMIGAGDLIQAEAFAREAVAFAPGPLRNATLGLSRRPSRAARRGRAPAARGVGPHRRAAMRRCARWSRSGWLCTRWGGCGARTSWTGSQRALDLASPGDPVRVEAQALLGLGLRLAGALRRGPRGV